MPSTPVQLSSVQPTLLPPTITGPIFKKASETSAVMQLARKVPLAVNAVTEIPIPMDIPTAGWVAEGGPKPVASGGTGVKKMTGKKVALLVPVSQEVVMTNPAGLYDQLVQDLPTAIGRAFDYAAIHGLDLKTGAAGPFSDYLMMTPNSQVIGASAPSVGGAYADLVLGLQKVVNVPGMNFTGFATDPRLKPELMLSTDTQGRPLFVDSYPSLGSVQPVAAQQLIGYPVATNSGVSGAYYRQGNQVQVVTINGGPTGGTFLLNVGGDTTSLAYNAAAATVQSAVQQLPLGAGVAVAGSAGGPYTFTFPNAAPVLTVNQKTLTGGTASSSQATISGSPVLDSGLRAIGGDWSQCAWGEGMSITIKTSTDASYSPDGGTTWYSAFQNNLVLLLVEAYYGFVVGNPNAFVQYTHAIGS